MKIRTHISVSVDGYSATTEGLPIILTAPDFQSGGSHVGADFIATCGAVVMGPGGQQTIPKPLQLISTRTFPDGSVEHTYNAAVPD